MGRPLRGTRALAVAVLAILLVALLETSVSHAAPADPRPLVPDAGLPSIDLRGDVRAPGPDVARRKAYQRWPGRTIRFYSAMDPSFDWPIDAAVRAWNRSGVRMTFKRVRSLRKAQLLIKPTSGLGIFGEATLGYNPWGGVRNNWVRLSRNALKDKGSSSLMTPWQRRIVTANIVAHELGHTLGIDHQPQDRRSCGLMTPVLFVGTCDLTGPELGHYRCGMTDAWVLARVVRKYGGRRTPGTTYCPLLPLPPVPAGLRISGGVEEDRPLQVDWVPPASVPAGTRMQVRVSPGDWCPARVGRDDNLWPTWADHTFEEHLVDPALGTWSASTLDWDESHEVRCVTARLVNEADGSAATVSLTRIPWYPQPGPPTVTGVEQPYSEGEYRVSIADAELDDWSLEHYVFAYPEGQCGAEPITYDVVAAARPSLYVRTEHPRPCLRVVALRGHRVSAPTTWQVG